MLTLIENGEIYPPEPRGRGSVLLFGGSVARVGEVDARAVEALGLELSVIDATGCLVTPGLIDPHEHLLGGSGEKGFSTQTPEIFLSELIGRPDEQYVSAQIALYEIVYTHRRYNSNHT